mmetsp:Transcript_18077/g.52159  ORF Transcript_18077/g.52159 Transcript_18077/m.52159 type:complete len:754 (+) Transcript_18077:63-2324(+)
MSVRISVMSATSSGAFFDGNVCIPQWYSVPRAVLRHAFQRLDVVHSPACPGQLRASLVQDAIRRFDEAFGIPRTDEARAEVVAQLDEAEDPGQVWWNAEPLYLAFRAQLCMREKIYILVDVADHSTVLSCAITVGLVLTTVLSIAVWMIGTMPIFCHMQCDNCPPDPPRWMEVLDEVCVYIFTLEYLARLLTVSAVRDELLKPQLLVDLIGANTESPATAAKGIRKFWAFLRSPYAIVDLLAVLPHWLELATSRLVDTRTLIWLRMFRILRLSRVFKLLRLLNSDLSSIGEANYLLAQVTSRALPACFLFFGLITTALLVFSGLIFTLERGDWYPSPALEAAGLPVEVPGQFYRQNKMALEVSPFDSIPSSAWWTLVTITSVGYGDAVPVTTLGKTVGFITILYGVVLLGLPLGIIGAQFELEFSRLATLHCRRQQAGRRRSLLVARVLKAASTVSLRHSSPRRLCLQRSFTLGSGNSSYQSASSMSSFGKVSSDNATNGSSKAAGRVCFPSEHTPTSKMGRVQTCGSGRSMTEMVSVRRMVKVGSRAVKKACAARAARAASAERRRGLPRNGNSTTQLMQARHALEDCLRIHSETVGISEQQRSSWLQELSATQLCAGPALDRLGARVLMRLGEEEKVRPGCSASLLRIRQSWHELCIACCNATDAAQPTQHLLTQPTPLVQPPATPQLMPPVTRSTGLVTSRHPQAARQLHRSASLPSILTSFPCSPRPLAFEQRPRSPSSDEHKLARHKG